MVGSVAHSLPTKGHKHGIQSQEQAGKRRCLSSVDSSCRGGEAGGERPGKAGFSDRTSGQWTFHPNFSPDLSEAKNQSRKQCATWECTQGYLKTEEQLTAP